MSLSYRKLMFPVVLLFLLAMGIGPASARQDNSGSVIKSLYTVKPFALFSSSALLE